MIAALAEQDICAMKTKDNLVSRTEFKYCEHRVSVVFFETSYGNVKRNVQTILSLKSGYENIFEKKGKYASVLLSDRKRSAGESILPWEIQK